jgi:hypothetical protein
MKMLSRVLFLFILASVIQCSSIVRYRFGEKPSPKLDEYLAMFHEEMDKRDVHLDYRNISLRFTNKLSHDNYVAVSYPFVKYRFVDVLRGYFDHAPAEEREAIVVHELGHTFGLKHLDDMQFLYPFAKFCPISVMHSYSNLQGCYFSQREQYFNELAFRIKKLDGSIEI